MNCRAFPPAGRTFLVALLIFLGLAGVVRADASRSGADPAMEKRVQALSEELRCLVCQNQTIADSNAELAQDLRREIRTMIRAGKSDREILDFMVTRYGDFVLYKPPLKATTVLLWAGPALLLVVGLAALIRNLRRRATVVPEEAPLSAEEQAKAGELLQERSAGE